MEDKRRGVLKKLSAISIWSTPIVHSVTLPAHAQTSVTDSTNQTSNEFGISIDSCMLIDAFYVSNGQYQINNIKGSLSTSDGSSLAGYKIETDKTHIYSDGSRVSVGGFIFTIKPDNTFELSGPQQDNHDNGKVVAISFIFNDVYDGSIFPRMSLNVTSTCLIPDTPISGTP